MDHRAGQRRPSPVTRPGDVSQPFATVLRGEWESVLAAWSERVACTIPAAKNLSPLPLRGQIPALLQELVRGLKTRRMSLSAVHSLAHAHGLLRARQASFDVDDIFLEVDLLREAIRDCARDCWVDVESMTQLGKAFNAFLRSSVKALSDNAQASFTATESRFEQMVRAVVDHAIFLIDPNGVICTWNEGCRELKQYEANEVIGKHFSLLYPEADRPQRPERNLGIAHREGRYQEEWWRRKKDGSLFWAKVTMTMLRSETGEVRGYLKVVTDLTERKRYEEELKGTNRDLEAFAAVAAHDLKEPLRTVMMLVRLEEKRNRDSSDQSALEYATLMRTSLIRMNALIENLLAYARSGGSSLKKVRLAVAEVVQKALARVVAALNEAGATVDVDELPSVVADEMLLTQVFQNLIGNAIKFRKADHSPRIRVGAFREGKQWVFFEQDDGIGMCPADAYRVFGAFERVHAQGEFAGSGLGLTASAAASSSVMAEKSGRNRKKVRGRPFVSACRPRSTFSGGPRCQRAATL